MYESNLSFFYLEDTELENIKNVSIIYKTILADYQFRN